MSSGPGTTRTVIVYLAPDVSYPIVYTILGFLLVPVLIALFVSPSIRVLTLSSVSYLLLLTSFPLAIYAYQRLRKSKEDTSRARLKLMPDKKWLEYLPGPLAPYPERRLSWDASALELRFATTDFRFEGDHAFAVGTLLVRNTTGAVEELHVSGLHYAKQEIIDACKNLSVPEPKIVESYTPLYEKPKRPENKNAGQSPRR